MESTAILCLFAFAAGLIDAVVGGGGLIQIPALLNMLPSTQPVALLGTNKLSAACGTAFAARSYAGRVKIHWSLVLPAAIAAFCMSFLGAAAVSAVPQTLMRPLILVLLVIMAVYTFIKKDFGSLAKPLTIGNREKIISTLMGGAIGFYDGLFGPGTGSFLIFVFIRFFAMDFLQASASAKFVNLATNIAALLFFIPAGKVIYAIAIPMAFSNVLGAFVGTRIAVKHGAPLVRMLFIFLLIFLIAKLTYDVIK